jgi:hypothetical protein
VTNTETVRRLAPPDRRSPVKVGVRACPLGRGCYCCPAYTSRFRGMENAKCELDHPATDRLCIPPYPERIPACPERQGWPQDPQSDVDGWRAPRHECCVECGRITARRWTRPADGAVLPWCAGVLPEPPQAETVPAKKRNVRYNPGLRRHCWTKTSEHWKHCDWCGIRVNNRPDPHSPRWFQEWDWPAHPEHGDGNNYAGGKVPDCPGAQE